MLILQDLKDMEPHTIFAWGEIVDSPEGVNMSNSGKMLRWVAVRGGMYDWTIYCHFADKDYEWIKRQGDKIYFISDIRKLVECDNEAFEMYRY